MKVGDKVILRKFEGNKDIVWLSKMDKYIGDIVIVGMVDDGDNTFTFDNNTFCWLQSACEPCLEPVKKERYFLFAYSTGSQTGNIWLKSDKIPSYKFLKEDVRKNHGVEAVITNIFEFKSEQDYLDFTRNE